MFNEYNDLITLEEFCEILSIGKNTAYKLLSSNQIGAFRIGRIWKIPRIAVENYILQKSTPTTKSPKH